MTSSAQVLFVCDGNICRSPLAKFALIQYLEGEKSASVESAGLGALRGHPMDDEAAEALRRLGGFPGPHVAQQISPQLVESSQIVLTMSKRQRDLVIAKNPRAIRKVFTLVELEKYIINDSSVSLSELALKRGTVVLNADDDVPDPYRQGTEVHDYAAAIIVRACRAVAEYFNGASLHGE